MAILKTDSPLARRIARSFLQFLNSVEPSSPADGEELLVAEECLAEAFKIDRTSLDNQSNCDSLIDMFSSREGAERPDGNEGGSDARNLSARMNAEVFVGTPSMDVNNQDLKRTSYKPVEMSKKNHLIKNQQLFAYIPPEIIIGILSRLPVRSILSCKCVCKSWLTLLESNEFVKSHLLKAIPGLAVCCSGSVLLVQSFDIEGLDLEHHGVDYNFVTKFNIPGFYGRIAGSADGLLFLCDTELKHHALHVCNPITRDYIELDCNEFVDNSCDDIVTYGFGSSKITGHHKVVRIIQEFVPAPGGPPLHRVPKSECVCHVYTIGTGLWRRISPVAQLLFRRDSDGGFLHDNLGAFLNGNLHWSVSDFEGPQLLISCFDLETERFSTFSTPLRKSALTAPPTIFEDCLCLCDTRPGRGIAIWLMKEYGVEKSWAKQFFIIDDQHIETTFYYEADCPIKIFEHGDILLAWDDDYLYYSKKNDAVLKYLSIDHIDPILYIPGFLSLKSFGTEKVVSLMSISACVSVD